MANLIQAAEELEFVPKNQLAQMSQDPNSRYPSFLVLSEIQRRTQMEKMYNAERQAMEMPTTTVAEEKVAELMQPQGLAGMGANGSAESPAADGFSPGQPMPVSPMQEMTQYAASGGRTGFQNIGATSHGPIYPSRQSLLASLGIDPSGMTEEEIQQALLQAEVPRGTRNNNPLNIRYDPANDWQGQIGKDDDGFAIFETPDHAMRAGDIILGNYDHLHGIDTISDAMERFAPASDDNDPEAYADFIASRTGMGANQRIDLSNPDTRQSILTAQSAFETPQVDSGLQSYQASRQAQHGAPTVPQLGASSPSQSSATISNPFGDVQWKRAVEAHRDRGGLGGYANVTDPYDIPLRFPWLREKLGLETTVSSEDVNERYRRRWENQLSEEELRARYTTDEGKPRYGRIAGEGIGAASLAVPLGWAGGRIAQAGKWGLGRASARWPGWPQRAKEWVQKGFTRNPMERGFTPSQVLGGRPLPPPEFSLARTAQTLAWPVAGATVVGAMSDAGNRLSDDEVETKVSEILDPSGGPSSPELEESTRGLSGKVNSYLKQADGLDVAKLGGIIMSSRNTVELGEGITALAQDIQTRKTEEEARQDELQLRDIQGELYRAQTDKVYAEIEDMPLEQINQLLSAYAEYQKGITEGYYDMSEDELADFNLKYLALLKKSGELQGIGSLVDDRVDPYTDSGATIGP